MMTCFFNPTQQEAAMKKQLLPLAVLTAATLCATPALAGNKAETLSFTPFVGGFHFDPTSHLDPAIIYGAKVGYNFTERLGIDGVFEYGKTTRSRSDDISVLDYRLEGIYHMLPKNRLVPYLAVGYGGLRFKDNSTDMHSGVFDYGVGAKYFISDTYAIRGDARHLIVKNGGGTYNYAEYTLGLQINLEDSRTQIKSAEPAPVKSVVAPVAEPAPAPKPAPLPAPAPAPAPKPVPVPPAVKPAPAPGPTASLTALPASLETGNQATLNWTAQNSTDCSITPAIGPVQTNGSMIVTPSATTAYTLSCSGPGGSAQSSTTVSVRPKPIVPQVIDSDKDGVPDPKDKCPDTPAGVKVDKNGCPPPVSSCKNFNLEIEFDTAKADIKPIYSKEIKKVADFLKENERSTASIEGHTDNIGSADMNLKLSQRRADAVRNYLVEKFGIAAARITAKGFGLTKPQASNKTAKGRYENRRVEALMYCGEK